MGVEFPNNGILNKLSAKQGRRGIHFRFFIGGIVRQVGHIYFTRFTCSWIVQSQTQKGLIFIAEHKFSGKIPRKTAHLRVYAGVPLRQCKGLKAMKTL